jgi:hypothetical protein
LSKDRVLTINQHGEALTVWDIATAKALVNIPVRSSTFLKTAFNADRSLLAIVMEDGIAIIDLAAARHVATLPVDGDAVRSVAFRDDNLRLAALSDRGLAVWDLTNGEELVEFYRPVLGHGSELAWAGEFPLVESQYLFDAQRRILLWEYRSAPGSTMMTTLHHGRMWAVSQLIPNHQSMLISIVIPHPAAVREASQLPSADKLLVVRPGDKVAIQTDIGPGIISPDEVRESLTKELEAAGLRVVDDAELVVKAVCKQQEQQTIRINIDNRLPVRKKDIVERTITPHASYLEMTLHGEVVWKRGYLARPGAIFFLEKGESLDQALERLTKPNLDLFKNAGFSGYVARPGKATDNGAYGVSNLTTRGLVDGRSPDGGASF